MSNDDAEEAQREEEGESSQNLTAVFSSGNGEDLEQVNAPLTPTKPIFSSHANNLLKLSGNVSVSACFVMSQEC